ncbi:hypothetical protein MTO96_047540 [Rhipicephalus appendiculatus]
MGADLDAMSCSLWGRGAAPQSAIGLLLAMVNLVTHVPFTDLPNLRDYELGELRKQYDYGCPLPRGKVLGGSSAINDMLYVRGNRHDYDRWEQEYGAKGWAYKDVLAHFRDIEDYRVGPLDGCSRVQTNVNEGERVSAGKAFIQPVIGTRKNLHVAPFSQATKVTFDGSRALGVQFTRFGEQQNVSTRLEATLEVVLSAGAVGSAQLLLLSGIGPKKDLERLQIPVVADLPVGRNLQDHVAFLTALQTSTDNVGIPS